MCHVLSVTLKLGSAAACVILWTPAFKDKSGDIKKVVIVRRRLI